MPDTAILADDRPSEVRLSLDGNRIYSADKDGFLRVYDAKTGTLVASWDVGVSLGGMDISPDGTFLVIADRELSAVYKVDTSTGAQATYLYSTSGYNGLLFDVAVLSDGTALFSQNFNGSGWTPLNVLDFGTGTFTHGAEVRQSSVFSRSASGDRVLIGEPNTSGGTIDIYTTGTGITATNGAAGFNWGIQAFSGDLAAQYIYNEGIHIYGPNLEKKATLLSWNYGAVSDLAFSADGRWLYVLDNESNSIHKVSTVDWGVVASIPVSADVGGWLGQVGATTGSRLILDPQQRYFSVVTDTGLVLVGNPDAPTISGTDAGEVVEGFLLADRLFGLNGDDVLAGLGGNDTLDGGFGFDTMIGGTGDDYYFIDLDFDRVIESNGEGYDTAFTSINFTLEAGSEVEALRITNAAGRGAIQLTGNGFNQVLAGNAGANVLDGRGGDDYLEGRGGNDTLDGGTGNDVLRGGTGDDYYIVDSVTDRMLEAAGEGFDTAFTSVSFTLEANSEIDALRVADASSLAAINLTGNELNQILAGNAGANVLNGGGGDDYLEGQGGNDTLDGGTGHDVLRGGTGDDFYLIDSFADRALESAGEGFDTAFTTVSFTLEAGSEVDAVRVSDASRAFAIHLTGNDLAQILAGAGGDDILRGAGGDDYLEGRGGVDTLDGGTGDDVLRGGSGFDYYLIDSAADRVLEAVGEGHDTAFTAVSFALEAGAEVEELRVIDPASTATLNLTGNEYGQVLAGNAGANVLRGGGGDDYLQANGGNDVLDGGSGNDVLFGGDGADRFAFADLGGTDRVMDFVRGTDKIDLTAVDAVAGTAGDQAFAFIGANAFSGIAGQLRTYEDGGVGYLAGDVDGNGIADFVINLAFARVDATDLLL